MPTTNRSRLFTSGGLTWLLVAPALASAEPDVASHANSNVLDRGPRRGLRENAAAPAPAPQASAAALPFAQNQNVTGFLQTSGTSFAINGKPYAFGGTNAFSAAQVDLYTDAQVDTMMQAHAQEGARVIRFFAFSNGNGTGSIPTPQPIQPEVGTFDETALQRMDLVIASAAKYGMRVIMPLVNFEPAFGGMQWYVDNILGTGQDKELFYTDPQCQQAYKNYVSLLVNRINTVTNIPYKKDPAIAACKLSNEVHTSNEYEINLGLPPGKICNTWLSEMSTFIKSLGINQLVSTGEEGYRADGPADCCSDSWINGGFKGVDFVADVQLPNIDFATVHYYPDNWALTPDNYLNYSRYFLSDRAAIAHQAGKPIIVEETGLGYLDSFAGYDRDTFLTNIYGIADQQNFAGGLIWQAWPVGTPDLTGYDFAYEQSGGDAVVNMYYTMGQRDASSTDTVQHVQGPEATSPPAGAPVPTSTSALVQGPATSTAPAARVAASTRKLLPTDAQG